MFGKVPFDCTIAMDCNIILENKKTHLPAYSHEFGMRDKNIALRQSYCSRFFLYINKRRIT